VYADLYTLESALYLFLYLYLYLAVYTLPLSPLRSYSLAY
jgi:hypothetical protein